MKIIIGFLLLVLKSNVSFAQFPIHNLPTQFDKFIEQPEIKWAAYRIDMIRFTEINFSELLRAKFEKDQINVSEPIMVRTNQANEIIYIKKKAFDERPGALVLPIFDSTGAYDTSKVPPTDYTFDSLVYNFFNVTEIFYVEGGKLKTYTPWVSPLASIYYSNNEWLGRTEYFSTAFNLEYNFIPPPNDKIIFLGKSYFEIFLDSVPKMARLKELYGTNFIEQIWPHIFENNYQFFSAKTNERLTPNDINISLIHEGMQSFIYDDSIPGKKLYLAPGLNARSFKKAGITQKWYYDESRNIVYNSIQEIILSVSENGWDEGTETKPILKIVF